MLKRATPGIDKLLKEEKLESVECPVCKIQNISQNDLVLETVGYPDVPVTNVVCKNCGLIRINPRMTLSGYDRFYKETFFEYLDPYGRPAYVQEIEHTVDDNVETPTKKNEIPFLLPFTKQGGRVLDVGAGFGQILYLLKKHKNIIPFGIEPDPESRKVAREKIGMELMDETIESFFAKNNEKYDLIMMEQVYEHLLDPFWTLQEMKKRLEPDGFIYIGVPNGYRPAMPYELYFQLAHTYNYMPYSFYKLADMAGLKVHKLDPMVHPLKVVLVHKENPLKEEDMQKLMKGKDYKDTLAYLRKIKYREIYGSKIKNIVSKVIGEKNKDRLRVFIDRLIGYRK